MSVIQWPNLGVAGFKWKKAEQAVSFRSLFGAQSMTVGTAFWEVDLSGIPQYHAQANQTVAFLESLNGYANQLELWNLIQPVPEGTMRGTMTLNASAAQGATSLQIIAATEAGKTLLAGDLLGLGTGTTQQVVRVLADATADGSGIITVTIGTPLRNAFSAGAAVTWNKPKALFRQKTLNEGIEYAPIVGQPWTLSLIEDWRP